MTDENIPSHPSVLNTTVLSNFAYIDHLQSFASLSGICTAPVVREELHTALTGIRTYSWHSRYSTLESLVAPISETVANREAVVSAHLDPGEAQAFALADAHDGRLLTDDGDARAFAKEQGVTVIGSVGVLLAAADAGKIDETIADEWLSTWIDKIGYYVPYRTITEYR